MAESTSNQKRKQRSAARNQRRSPAAEPSEALDEAKDAGEGGSVTGSTVKYAALVAAAGAAAGALAGAAKVLVDRRNEAEQQAQESNGMPPQAEPEPQAEAQPEAEAEDTEMESPRSSEDESEAHDDAEVDEESQARDEPEPPSDEREGGEDAEGADAGSKPQGASADEFTEIVEEAKRKLEELLGVEPERVSGFDRSNGRSTVTLEVVEVHRVPETTDVLASYEVAFDEDRNLVSMSEVRRYLRSQTDEGR